MEKVVDIKNSKYREVAILRDRDGEYAIMPGRKDPHAPGKYYLRWCYPQTKRNEVSDKPVPMMVNLGDKNSAISIMRELLSALTSEDNPTPEQDDIPFLKFRARPPRRDK